MKRWFTLVVLGILVLSLLPVVAVSAQQENVVLGLVVPNTDAAYYEGISNGAAAAAADFEADLLVLSSEGDTDTELVQVEALIEQGVAALLLSPVDAEGSAQAVAAANAADVPVIMVGQSLNADDESQVVSVIGVDEMDAGWMAASVLCDALDGAGYVLELVGEADDIQVDRQAGAADYLAEECAKVELTPLDVTGLEHDALVDAVIDALNAEKYDGVLSYSDAAGLGALEASFATRQSSLTQVTFNATDDVIAALESGRLFATITPSALMLGGVGVEASLAYLDGAEVAETIAVDLMALDITSVLDLAAFRDPGRGGSYRFGGGGQGSVEDGGRGGEYRGGDGTGETSDGGRGGEYRGGDDTGETSDGGRGGEYRDDTGETSDGGRGGEYRDDTGSTE